MYVHVVTKKPILWLLDWGSETQNKMVSYMPLFPFFTSKYSIWVLCRFWTTLRTGCIFPHIHFTCITRVIGTLYIVSEQLPGPLRGHTKVISLHLSQVGQEQRKSGEWTVTEAFMRLNICKERQKSSVSKRGWNQVELPWLRGFQEIPRRQKLILLSWLFATE